MRVAAALLVIGLLSVDTSAQNFDVSDSRFSSSLRIGWLITAGEGYVDRPVVEGAVGYDLIPESSHRPVVSITGSSGVAIGDAFAEVTLWSFRFAGGVELRVPVRNIQLVSYIQSGFLTAIKEDQRTGLYNRIGFGIRVATAGSFRYSFDPISFTRLPLSEESIDSRSRYGLEVGVIRAVWHF